eukprot:CCRYP_006429-RB/>CCRYP_006429-RB protein AED:0.17 eAED:1.00 QI:0/-1/0/1/-1/0/1/0/82
MAMGMETQTREYLVISIRPPLWTLHRRGRLRYHIRRPCIKNVISLTLWDSFDSLEIRTLCDAGKTARSPVNLKTSCHTPHGG